MPTTKKTTTVGSIEKELSATKIFELLADERRQLAMQYLTQTVGSVHLGDLADQVALWEGEHSQEQYERVATSLVHIHLPKLTEAGVVEYDRDGDQIRLSESANQLAPYLELATPASIE